MSDQVIFDLKTRGHRADYLRVFSKVLKCDAISGVSFSNMARVLAASRLLCSSCDDYLPFFFVIAMWRAYMGRKTVAIATRPESVFKRNQKLRQVIKCVLYRLMKKNRNITTYSILPFYVEPRLAGLVSDWIYDVQFWDREILWDANLISTAYDPIPAKRGRARLALPGNLSQRKGAHFMMDLFLASHKIRECFQFLLFGEIHDLDARRVESFRRAGGVLIDRRPSMDDLFGVYLNTDFIWSCYPAYFNHSSGVFGRALQLERPVVVRTGSYLDRFVIPACMKCSVRYGDIADGVAKLLNLLKGHVRANIFLSSELKVMSFFKDK